jgi:hypothetical protein
VKTDSLIQVGDVLSADKYGRVHKAEDGEKIFGYALEEYDPWPQDCVLIEEESDAPD